MATKAVKEITVLKRAVCKKASTSYAVEPGDVVFLLRGEKNSTHVTTLRNNGHNSCTCTGNASFGKNCYHIKGCEKANNARINAAKVTIEFPIEVVEAPTSAADKEWAQYRSELAKKLAQQYMTTQCVEQVVEALVAPAKTPIAKLIEQAVQTTIPATDLSKRGDLAGTRKYSLLR